MCIASPYKIEKIKDNRATIFAEDKKEIDISLLENPKVGDWILVHEDIAVNTIPEKEAQGILELTKKCKHKHK